jgi:hypothetical protein
LDCAFKLFPRWVVDELQFNSEGACISAEILTQCIRGGISICEVPVNHFPRAAGKATGANLGVVVKAFKELPIVWQYRRMSPWDLQRRPAATADSAGDVRLEDSSENLSTMAASSASASSGAAGSAAAALSNESA